MTSDDVYDAIILVVCEQKSQAKRADRRMSEIIDDCIAMARTICPTVEDLPGASPALIRQHTACSEALARFERIRPLVRALGERGGIRRLPR